MGCHADSRSVTFGHVRCANMRLIVRICISQRIVMESRSDWCVTDAIRESCQRDAVFDTMSADWGGEEDGFVLYEIPEEYSRTGGYFPEKMQVYTYCVCKQYGVRYDLVVALIEKESGYKFDKVGDDGHSIGYMQIYEECHRDRMERLNVTDLTNPYQNVLVGTDYLSELIERYGTIQDALAAYNYGEQGAKQHLWKNGIYVYEYNQTIMSRMKEIEEELEQDAGD